MLHVVGSDNSQENAGAHNCRHPNVGHCYDVRGKEDAAYEGGVRLWTRSVDDKQQGLHDDKDDDADGLPRSKERCRRHNNGGSRPAQR